MSTFAKKVTSAVLAWAVVLTAVSTTAGVSAAYDNLSAANKLSNLGIIVDQSTNPSAYRLADTIQRKEVLKIMMKLSGKDVSQGACTSPYSDISNSDWACKYAVAAQNAGFIAANTNYRPNDKVSKIEALKMVMKARGIEKGSNADWRAAYVEAASAKGIATSFMDYNTSAERGGVFVWAAEAIAPSMDDATDTGSDDLGLGDLFAELGLDEDTATDDTDTTDDTTTDTDTTDTTTDTGTTDDTSTTGGSLTVSLNPETPSDGLAQHSTARIPLLVFDVKAGSEDVTLNKATLEFIGLGDYNKLEDVSVYNSIGEKVSKTKSFSEMTREISFDRDVVVEAGKTMTLTIAGKLATGWSDNATYGIKLIDLETSATVEGEDLVGALLVPATFSNVPSIKVTEDKATGDVTIGENMKLAGVEIEETADNGDVLVNTITFHLTGQVDSDDVTDLAVLIDGTEVVANLMVNSDEEIVAAVNYTLASDDKVSVELKGTVIGSVGDSIDFRFEWNDDVYATSVNTGMPVAISNTISTEDIASLNNIEGSEINVTFDKSDVDEAKPDADEVSIGTLKMTATSDDYEVTKLEVKVTGTARAGIDDLELGGSSYDSVVTNATDVTYTFEDITLTEGEEIALELTMDVNDDNTLNGKGMNFSLTFKEIEDDTNDITYTSAGGVGVNVSDVLSTTALNNQSIDIESAGITISNVQVNERELVLGNGVETVLYKGKISVSDSDAVSIDDIDFKAAAGNTHPNSLSGGQGFDDIIANATLNIGGQTFDADIDSNSIDFSNINAVIEAGSDNIEVLVTAVLKDNSNIANGDYLAVELDTTALSLEDSDNDDLVAANVTVNNVISKIAETKLLDRGTFLVKVVKNGDLKDDIEDTVLAGASAVALAEVEIQAEYEDVDVDTLKFQIAGDFSDSLLNVNLVAADGTVIASDAVVNLVGANTEIVFENFTVSDSDDVIDAKLVADLRAYDTTGDVTKGQLGNIVVMAIAPLAADLEGDASNDPITTITHNAGTAGDSISVVPALVTVAIDNTLGNNDKYAALTFTIDKGNNEFDNDNISITKIALETAIAAPGLIVRNEDNVTVANNDTTAMVMLDDATATDYEISTGDKFEFKVATTTANAELRILPNGISYTLDGNTYTTNNDDVLNLGEYDNN